MLFNLQILSPFYIVKGLTLKFKFWGYLRIFSKMSFEILLYLVIRVFVIILSNICG